MITLHDINIEKYVTDTPSDDEIMANYMPNMWIDEEAGVLNENTFANAFSEINNLTYQNGLFYTRNGKMTEEILARDIWKTIANVGVSRNVAQYTKKLLEVVKLSSTVDKLVTDRDVIPFANGDLHLYKEGWEFHENSYGCTAYRLPTSLPRTATSMKYFNKWLNDLFYPEDIRTIRQYLGYCLVPTTQAQKALFLIGDGGAGKSALGAILSYMLGDAMVSTPNTKDFLEDKFKLPELENKLVLYDDDLDSEALTGTGLYKKLITNTLPITADRKYGQPFTFKPYAKIVACCNEMLSSRYDNTDGFFRRLLPIYIKPKRPDFVPDPAFYEKLRAEIPGILLWSLTGLQDLIESNWVLYQSDRSLKYLAEKKIEGNPFDEFLTTVLISDAEAKSTTSDILKAYDRWCSDNGYDAMTKRSVQRKLNEYAHRVGAKASDYIVVNGKRLRGYIGLKIDPAYAQSTFITGL